MWWFYIKNIYDISPRSMFLKKLNWLGGSAGAFSPNLIPVSKFIALRDREPDWPKMEAKDQDKHVFWNFVDLSGLYIFMFHYSHAFYFIICSICPKIIEYVEKKELWINTYNLQYLCYRNVNFCDINPNFLWFVIWYTGTVFLFVCR